MKVELIAHTPQPLKVIAMAASVCYDSEPNLKIVKGCFKSGHLSVMEHASFTFKIEGVSRALTHQLVRHRIASYSQQSQRYVDMSDIKVYNFITPSKGGNVEKYAEFFNNAIETYKELVELGEEKEDARSVLPNATPSTIVVTMNLHALINFMNERCCMRAQQEIRILAHKMKQCIVDIEELEDEEVALLSNMLGPKCEKNGYCPEIKGCGRKPTVEEKIKSLESIIEDLEKKITDSNT